MSSLSAPIQAKPTLLSRWTMGQWLRLRQRCFAKPLAWHTEGSASHNTSAPTCRLMAPAPCPIFGLYILMPRIPRLSKSSCVLVVTPFVFGMWVMCLANYPWSCSPKGAGIASKPALLGSVDGTTTQPRIFSLLEELLPNQKLIN